MCKRIAEPMEVQGNSLLGVFFLYLLGDMKQAPWQTVQPYSLKGKLLRVQAHLQADAGLQPRWCLMASWAHQRREY